MALIGETGTDRRSLDEVHGTVRVAHRNPLRRLFAFMGPAYLVSVGYMDPGNWATDLQGGADFGYKLLWVLLMSNLMAVLLQTLSARLGVVTGHDLAQACRAEYSRPVNVLLWILAEIAIAATDLAEVLGTIIALKLLFGLPMLWGCLVTALDTFVLLYVQKLGIRKIEGVILGLVATIGLCFLIQIVMARPEPVELARGFIPTLPQGALFVAIGILGATVMPHNLYLHSALVQSRRIGTDDSSKAVACKYNLVDSAIALNAAFFVNAAILILSASVFYKHGIRVEGIEQAHELLPGFLKFRIPYLGEAAPVLFGVALLCAGQSSTLTGTLAGQIVMEGHLHLRIAPWLRRLLTRFMALAPAVLTIALFGEGSTQKLLLLSQVILSLQLSFAIIPLIQFTSSRARMGRFASPIWVRALAFVTAAIIVALNGQLVLDNIQDWLQAAEESGLRIGPLPIRWPVAAGLYTLLAAVGGLLLWVIVKPWISPSPRWEGRPRLVLDWARTLRPRPITSIGVAVEHSPADAEILSRALSLGQPGKSRYLILHVADAPMTGVYGDEAGDMHTESDRDYLSDLVATLNELGYRADSALLYGADRAGRLVTALKERPVDLLVVGSHGHGMVRDLLFGQTVDSLRHGLEIPMLIARPQPADEPDSAALPD
ncbi:MAG: Nramp family divalent metal transporter [Isosphaeraceae bacterium]